MDTEVSVDDIRKAKRVGNFLVEGTCSKESPSRFILNVDEVRDVLLAEIDRLKKELSNSTLGKRLEESFQKSVQAAMVEATDGGEHFPKV